MVNRQSIEHLYRTTIYEALVELSIRWLPQAVLRVELLLIIESCRRQPNEAGASMTFRAKPLRSKAEAGSCRHYFHSSAPRLVLREKVDKLQRAM